MKKNRRLMIRALRNGFLLLGVLFAAAGTPRALAQTPPLGDEFPVNAITSGQETRPAVVIDSLNGTSSIGWQRSGTGGDNIARRSFHADGSPSSSEALVNSFTTGDQTRPRAAGDPESQFVVVWESYDQDGDQEGIFAQRYDKNGALGSEFRVNAYTTDSQSNPAVAANSSGSFVVVWESYGQDGDDAGIFAQRFDNTGAKVGTEFQVNTYTTSYQSYPAVAMDAAGKFVVVWQSYKQDGSSTGVVGRRFDSTGAPQGGEFRINVTTTGYQQRPRIASDAAGNFVVVWHSANVDGDGSAVVGRRFGASGSPRSGELTVNTFTLSAQMFPDVAMDPAGNFLVVWQSRGQEDFYGDPYAFGVFARAFSATGRPSSNEFQVNTYTTGYQVSPTVALVGRGDFVIAWQSNGQDGYGAGIFARRGGFPPPQALDVDAHSAAGTSSNLNGVLEPGENVLVEPLWQNTGATGLPLTGTASDFTGPAGTVYTLADGSANYGTIAAGTASDCRGATGNCYRFAVSAFPLRPTHWDARFTESLSTGVAKVWTLHVGDSYQDVPRSHPFYKKIETLFHSGITFGCSDADYCPGDPVTRGQMAIFIAKGIAGTPALVPTSGLVGAQPYNCVSGGVSVFTDVLPTDIYCKQVHYIAAQNVTLGCSATKYCPGDTVTRLQMSAFIAKATVAPGGGPAIPLAYGPDPVTGLSYSCDAGSPDVHFTDVPATDAFCKHVHYLWAKGIIAGCGGTSYCPSAPVTRDAMAKFLVNAFALQLYGPGAGFVAAY
jgi:hypothetical protein